MSSSVGMMTFPIYVENKKCSKPRTRQKLEFNELWIYDDICALPTRQTAILLLSFGFHAFETVLGEALVHVLYWCCPSKKILKHQSCCHAIFWSQAATSSKKDLKVLALGEGPPLPLLARQGKPSQPRSFPEPADLVRGGREKCQKFLQSTWCTWCSRIEIWQIWVNHQEGWFPWNVWWTQQLVSGHVSGHRHTKWISDGSNQGTRPYPNSAGMSSFIMVDFRYPAQELISWQAKLRLTGKIVPKCRRLSL